MTGSWNNGRAHYRCKLNAADAHLAAAGHPPSIYVREDQIVERLDEWLGDLFAPARRADTIDTLQRAGEDPAEAARRRAAQAKLRSCDERLATYRRALEAGTDPTIVAAWIAEVTAERTRYEVDQARADNRPRLSRREIETVVDQMASLADVLRRADPRDRAEIYAQMQLKLTYQNERKIIVAETAPIKSCTYEGVRGGTPGLGTYPRLRAELQLA